MVYNVKKALMGNSISHSFGIAIIPLLKKTHKAIDVTLF